VIPFHMVGDGAAAGQGPAQGDERNSVNELLLERIENYFGQVAAAAALPGASLPEDTDARAEARVTEPDELAAAAEAVLVSLDSVAAADPTGLCQTVMGVLSLLSPRGVSRHLLHAAGQTDLLSGGAGAAGDRLVDEALERLREAALLSFSADGTWVSGPRRVMRVVRESPAHAESLELLGAGVCGLLRTVTRLLRDQWRNRAVAWDLFGQVTALHEHLAPSLSDTSPLARELLEPRGWALSCLLMLGAAPGQAVACGQALLADCDRLLGAGLFETVPFRSLLGLAYQAEGRTAEAISLLEQVLVVSERMLGADNPFTVTSWENLAGAYRHAGRTIEAVPLLERALADSERVLGADHPFTLTCWNNLGLAYQAAGWKAEAIPLLERALADRERVLGADHPDTLASRAGLADACRAAGRASEAIPLLERVLADRERLLGADHRSTLISRSNLGLAYRAVGRTAEAILLNERTLAGMERMLGAGHPFTLTCRNNLGLAYQGAGRTAEAILLLERTLADCERLLGTEHPTTDLVRTNLATVAGKWRDRKRWYQRNLRRALSDRTPPVPDEALVCLHGMDFLRDIPGRVYGRPGGCGNGRARKTARQVRAGRARRRPRAPHCCRRRARPLPRRRRVRRRAAGGVRDRRGHGDPRCRWPQPGHSRLRGHRGSRTSGCHRRRPVSCPGEQVLPAHALPCLAGRTRCGDPGRGGRRGGLGEDHRRLPRVGRGRAGARVDRGDIRSRNTAPSRRRSPYRRGAGGGAQQSPRFRAGGDGGRLDRARQRAWPC